MKTNIRKFKVTKKQLATIITLVESRYTSPDELMEFGKLQRLKKDILFTKLETILKPYKKYTRALKIAFNFAQCKLPERV